MFVIVTNGKPKEEGCVVPVSGTMIMQAHGILRVELLSSLSPPHGPLITKTTHD